MAVMVALKYLIVMLHVHCPSCYI